MHQVFRCFGLVGAHGDNGFFGNNYGAAYVYTPPAGRFVTFGTGCPGSVGVASLDAAPGQVPWIGQTFEIELSGMPTSIANVPYTRLGLSKTEWGQLALHLELSPFGLFNCFLYVSPDASSTLVNNAGTATWQIDIPLNPYLIGLTFYVQGAVVDFGAAGFIIVTNAGEGVIGAR